MAPTASLKRTIVRLFSSLAPTLAAEWAADLWFTVPGSPTTLPPADGTPFTVTAQGVDVHGRTWGEGPVVYLVHGWGGRGAQLGAYVDPLVSSGHRVVTFDAPAHGASPAGPSGPGRTHGVEMGRALDAVAARFGPARAVVAHSMGAVVSYLTMRHGWLATDRLVLIAPMVEAAGALDAFASEVGLGRRSRVALEHRINETVGLPLVDFDARVQAAHVDDVPTLVVHDLSDRQTPYHLAQRLVRALPDARLVTTDALGHRRILQDAKVVRSVLRFVDQGEADRIVA